MNLRPATMDDARFLYDLRREPGYASQCFGPPPASFDAHKAWLRDWLYMFPGLRPLLIVEEDGRAVGMVRLSPARPAEVSIALVPEARGKGLCPQVLRAVAAGHPHLCARVKPDNEASLRAFEKAGFRRVAVEMVYP